MEDKDDIFGGKDRSKYTEAELALAEETQVIVKKMVDIVHELVMLSGKCKSDPNISDHIKIYMHAVGCAFATATCAAANHRAAAELGALCLLFNETGSNPEAVKLFGPTNENHTD